MTTENENLSKMIKSTRISMKMTQEEFGKQFTPPAAKSIVSRWEKAQSVPSTDRLLKISQLSGYSVDELLYGTLQHAISELMLEAIRKVHSFFEGRSYNPTEFIEQASNTRENVFFQDMFDFVQFKENSYFGTPRVSRKIMDKNAKDITENEQKKIDDFFSKEYLAGCEYLYNRTYKICKKIGIRSYEKEKIMHILAREAELKFNDIERTDEGLVLYVTSELDELYASKIPSFIYSTNAEGENVRLGSEINTDLENKISDMIANLSEQIYYLIHEKD
ncbi:helix-turn-helix domain-containing protein [Levilactobacillus brevis]|nr:helix-turn-helix transcriptional regulator [Levilactobacillus brevis]